MYQLIKFSFRSKDGKWHNHVRLELLLDDSIAHAKVFKDEQCQVELVLDRPYRGHARSATYAADPMPVAEIVIDACLSDLADGHFVEKEAQPGLSGAVVLFDQSKSARWACLGPKIRRLVHVRIAKLRYG